MNLSFFTALTVAAACVAGNATAAVFTYECDLSGPAEAPPNSSPGTGHAIVDYDNVVHTMRVRVTFSGLIGNTTASHIHAATAAPFTGTAGVATQTPSFAGFPLGVTSGTMDSTFDLTLATSFNAAFITANGSIAGAEAALFNAMNGNRAYLNIHTSFVSAGEIRGFLVQVPAPGTAGLLGVAALAAARRRRV